MLQTRRFKQFKRLVIKENPISEFQGRKAVEGHIHIAHPVVGVVRKEGEGEMGLRIEVFAGFVRIHEADAQGLQQDQPWPEGISLQQVNGIGFIQPTFPEAIGAHQGQFSHIGQAIAVVHLDHHGRHGSDQVGQA